MKKHIYLALKVIIGVALLYGAYVVYQIKQKQLKLHIAYEKSAALELKNRFSYDPLSCKTDAKGMLYVSHYERVFKIPFRGGLMIDPIYDKKVKAVQPIAPDLEEIVGCPNHPYAVSSVYYLYLYEAIKANKFDPPIAPMSADLVQIVFIPAGYEGGLDEEGRSYKSTCDLEIWHHAFMQKKFENDSSFVKKKFEVTIVKRQFKNGIVGCMVKPNPDKDKSREISWSSAYQADKNIYSTPKGGVFTIDCISSPECRVAYKIYPRLNLAYKFDKERRIPIERVIEFDKSLRKSIYDSEIKNYPWAVQAEVKKENDLTLPR